MRQFVGRRAWLGMVVGLGCAAGASAQTLTMGVGSPVSSLDPHYHQLRSNGEIAQSIFDTLVSTDAQARIHPAMAESWRALGTEGWEFRLREGIRFHDGTPFTADDVAFTLERIPTVTGPGASYSGLIRPVNRVEVVDDRTIRLYTSGPSPLLPTYLSQVVMLSRKIHAGAATADFNNGRVAIGTGPFRLVSYTNNDRIVLARNDQYWGDKAHWAEVNYRIITNDTARTAALLAGDVDFIDQVPTSDLARMRRDSRLRVAETTSLRVMYLTLDGTRETPGPGMAATGGGALDRNPLADARVRRALSMALDRRLIQERVMENAALASAQLMPPGSYSSLPDLPVPAADPEGARRLLAEAGWPQGFQITLAGSNDRYINDARVVQAVGQMWTRIGVRTTIEAQPYASFIGRATRREAPVNLLSWGNSTGEVSVLLNSVLRTVNRERGHGSSNRIQYSAPALDSLIGQAEIELDEARREVLLQQATRLVLEDHPVVPLYLQNAVWAMRSNLTYEARSDERNDPSSIRPAR
ncbi:ABC transporter substrate-binding protein [Roseococcus sp. YIM B11640]|uniref:ABC transporter substrate-binding protein n=1 Tax=Roseococcus sp. YIM B11640 TaxID=3133973 RepID=UPI003C7E3AD2